MITGVLLPVGFAGQVNGHELKCNKGSLIHMIH
jgi:hypothetical protein